MFLPRYYGGRPGEELARGLLRDKKQDEYPLSLQSDEKKDKVHWTKTENLSKKIIWKTWFSTQVLYYFFEQFPLKFQFFT